LRNNVSENRGRSTDTSVSGNAQSSVVNLQEKAQGGASNNSNFNFDKNQQGGGPVLPPPVTSDARNLSSSIGNATSASPYNFASQLSFIKTNSLGATGLPPAVEQVIFQLNRNVKSGNDQLSLQLNPTELGRVNIKLNINADGKVHGTVVASNPATLDLLLKDVRSLERALQDAGLRADSGSLQFSLGGQGQSDNAPGQPSSPKNSRVPDPLIDADGTLLESNETYVVTPGRVNLRV
jgi:flagellar hook-length control protein FliK